MDSEKKLTLRMKKITRKKVFAEFVASKQWKQDDVGSICWKCCNQMFQRSLDVYKHISHEHADELEERVQQTLKGVRNVSGASGADDDAKQIGCSAVDCQDDSEQIKSSVFSEGKGCESLVKSTAEKERCYGVNDVFPWLPAVSHEGRGDEAEGQVLLFYRYTALEDPADICRWQEELCRRLQLSGKIRISTEGLNGTVGGSLAATEHYVQAVLTHPCFTDMKKQDFKTSKGGRGSFPEGLAVAVHQEIVPMGKDPSQVSYKDAGLLITPQQFHQELQEHQRARETGQEPDRILVDCRNFYESKIGAFTDAVKPDIRKFSYWPEYVDKNQAMFADKKVLMYCTGGIRCERGSAYLKSKGICKEVMQLEGGIHRYLEQYPDGFYRGKLFVFDNRYSIQTNQDVLAACFHCSAPWDEYQPCTSNHCYQLVLSCPACRDAGLTTCCQRCAELATKYAAEAAQDKQKKRKEECSCTMNRERVPVEKLGAPS